MRIATTDTHDPPQRPRLLSLRWIAVAATILLVAAGCGDDGDDDTTAAADAEAGDEMTIRIEEPADGAEVGTPFDLELDASVPIGAPETGRHHVHVFYDGDTDSSDYDVVVHTTHTVDRSLEPGEHDIVAVIAEANHSLTDARNDITVTVGDGAPDAGTETDMDDGY
jgi:hypothetical protein